MICGFFSVLVKKSFLTSNLEGVFLHAYKAFLFAGVGGTHDNVSQKKTQGEMAGNT